MKRIVLIISLLMASASSFGIELVRPTQLPTLNINRNLGQINQASNTDLLEVSRVGSFGVSEVFLNDGSRSILEDANARRLYELNNVDSIILNNGSMLDQSALADYLKYKGQIELGTIQGSIYAVGGDGGQGGGG